jgi:phage terminase large subunit-like protein
VLRAVSSEGRTLDGHRGHIIIVDELHEHPNGLVLAKLRASVKGRRQPLVLSITNAGFDRTSVCFQQHAYGLQVLDGVAPNDPHFVYICQLDACAECRAAGHVAPVEGCIRCDSWKNESVWIKTNPNLPITPTLEYLREQVREATGMPGKESLVRRLNFCEWLESHSRWLDMEAWHAGGGDVADSELTGRPCFAGLDLGQSDDFSAFVRLWTLDDGRMVVRCRFWVPASALSTFPSRPYDVWRRAGRLVMTEGTVTDYDQVEAEVIELCREGGVLEVAYDKRFASQMALHLEGAGLTVPRRGLR